MASIRRKGLAVLLAALLLLCAGGCGEKNHEKSLSRLLRLDVTDGTVVTFQDSHGGFHGDGTAYWAMTFPDDHVRKTIEASSAWHPLPMTAAVNDLACQLPGQQPPALPEVERGWYFFYDRYDQSTDPWDAAAALERHSYNFTAAVYDADSDTLYCLVLDT